MSSLAVHQEISKCKTYRLSRCQPQAIIQQNKQKEEVKHLHTSRFHVASEALTFVFQCIPDEGQTELLHKETFVEEVDENSLPCFDKPFRQSPPVTEIKNTERLGQSGPSLPLDISLKIV